MNERAILEQRVVTLTALLETPGGPLGHRGGEVAARITDRWSAERRLLERLLAEARGDRITPTVESWRKRTDEFLARSTEESPSWSDRQGQRWNAQEVLELLADAQERLDSWQSGDDPKLHGRPVTVESHGALILGNGCIHATCSHAPDEALAVVDGRVAAVGSKEEAWAAVGSDSAELDLGGMVVLPGFIDAHLHWTNFALSLRRIQIQHDFTLVQVQDEVRRHIAHNQGAGWVLGRGWDHSTWGRWPEAADLDAVVPDRPAALTRKDGHAVWLNSPALAAMGFSDTSPDPPGGAIVRKGGYPTGILKENAVRLVQNVVPEPRAHDRQSAMVDAWPEAWRRGITGCHDMGVLGGTPVFHDLAALRDSGQLGLRFVWYVRHDGLEEVIGLGLRSGIGDSWLRVGGLKLFMDGTLGSLTADMLADFEGRRGNRGIATLDDETYDQLLRTAAEAGLASAVHCIGDGANRRALDGFERIVSVTGRGGLRHRVEHAQLLDTVDIPRFAKLGVVASMQPIHATCDMREAERHWGDRCANAYAWRSILDSGARLAFGSDSPIEALDVTWGLRAAVTRTDSSGAPKGGWHAEQVLSIEEALTAYTQGAAWASAQEEDLGDLTPGKRADLVLLDRSPFEVGSSELESLRIMATMIDGRWVWQHHEVDLGGPRGLI